MNRDYPDLMCFCEEPYRCGCEGTCPYYQSCKEEYEQRWYQFSALKFGVD